MFYLIQILHRTFKVQTGRLALSHFLSSITPGKEASSLGNLIPSLRISLHCRKIDKAFIILGYNQLYSVEYTYPFIRNHTQLILHVPKIKHEMMFSCFFLLSTLSASWFIEKDFHPLHVLLSVIMTCYHFDNMILVSPLCMS